MHEESKQIAFNRWASGNMQVHDLRILAGIIGSATSSHLHSLYGNIKKGEPICSEEKMRTELIVELCESYADAVLDLEPEE